jgi:hypothetical protein
MWMQVSSLPTNSSLQNTPRYQFSVGLVEYSDQKKNRERMAAIFKIGKISMFSEFNEN